jgi:RNA polymerase sigma-70 factor (ECF subfamily)
MNPTTSGCKFAVKDNRNQISDNLLVSAAKLGDANAFVELSNRHAKKILGRIYRITRNWEDAEDVLQDSFLKALIHLKKFEGRSSFSSWLTRIAMNSAFMLLRKKRTHLEVPIDGMNDDSEIWHAWVPRDLAENPENCYARREREELLRGAILELRPSLRNAIDLQQTGECSAKAIAQALGISVGAAKARVSRARLALRASLA